MKWLKNMGVIEWILIAIIIIGLIVIVKCPL